MSEKKKTPWIMKAAIIIGVLIIPLLYSYFYLGAFWDPYARLDDVPVAVVNLDKGAEINGEQRNIGQEICDNLKEDGTLKFVFTDKDDAEKGVLGDDYYASITIPEDFSSNASTASEDTEKLHGTIIYSANQKKNYLAAQILENAMPTIKETVNASIDKEIITTLCDKLESVPDSMGELQDGFTQLADGSSQLADGTGQLNSKAPTLASGVNSLNDGAALLNTGLATLNENSSAVVSGSSQLTSGAADLQDGVKAYTDGVASATDGSADLKAGIKSYTSAVSQASAGASNLYQGISDAGDGVDLLLSEVNKSSQKLAASASDELLDKLAAGSDSLSSGVSDFKTAYGQAMQLISAYQATGSSEYLTKAIQVLTLLNTKLDTMEAGAQQVDAGVGSLVSGMKEVKTNTSDLIAGLETLKAGFGDVKNDKTLIGGAYALNQGLAAIKSNNSTLNSGAQALNKGLNTISANSKALNSGASQLAAGASTLNTGIKQYTDGVGSAYDGSAQLADGTNTLAASVPALTDGITALNDGAQKLDDGINTAKQGVDDSVADTNEQLGALDGLADYSETPVDTETSYVQPVENYGSAFAPYFMCLSLWVGGLMIYFGIYLDYNRKIKSLTKDSNRIILRTICFGLISIAQGVLLGVVIKDCLHIVVNNPLMLFASCILVSLTFMTIIQFCIINLGDAGKFVSLLLLILQLTSCAGTFPIETQSTFFRVINKVLPMTYSTQLFKEAISGSPGANAQKSALVLVAFFAVFLALTLILSHSALKRDLKRIDMEAKQKVEQ